MSCSFTFFSAVFQSYQDDGWVIRQGCVQWNPIYKLKRLPQAVLKLRTARSVGQRLNLSVPETKVAEFAHSIDLDEVAHHQPPHQDLHCLPFSFRILNMK